MFLVLTLFDPVVLGDNVMIFHGNLVENTCSGKPWTKEERLVDSLPLI